MNDRSRAPDFYLTPAHPCSYLPGQSAQTLFLDPREQPTPVLVDALTQLGFRRSGAHLYRPHCASCQACIPTRIPVAEFAQRRRHRRVLRANADLHVSLEPASCDDAIYELYARYITSRHGDGDMNPPSPEQYRGFLLAEWADTFFVTSWLGERRVAVAVTDRQSRGLSALYTFFDPDLAERSLGAFSILRQIELCRDLHLPWLYLGYWIKDCRKMRYKLDYRPTEILVNGSWRRLS